MEEQMKAEKPKSLKEVPHYLKEVVGGTASRLLYIFKLVWEAKPSLLLVMLFMTVYNGVMPLVGTLITANLLAKVVQSFSEPVNLLPPLCLQFGYTLLNSIVTNLSSIITNISGEIVSNHVKVKIMTKAREVDLASFDMPDFYARLENASREAGSRPVQILNSAFNMISSVISLVSYVALLSQLLSRLDWKADVLFILFVGLNILTAVVNFHFRRKNFFYMRFRSKDRRQMDYYSNLMTNKDVVKEIRLFNLSDLFIGRYKDIFKNYFAGIKKIIWSQGGWQMFLSLCSAGLNMSLFYLIATNVKLIAEYSQYTASLNAISNGVGQVIQLSSMLYEGSLFIDNLILFMNEKKTIVPSLEAPVAPKRHCGHTIELKNVSFSYPGTTRKVLKNLNLTISPGETAVLVGLNGAGKTTLIKLITRLYDPTEGVILLDGRDIREYDVEKLYKVFGIIFQDFGKYAVDIRENIAFGDIQREIDDDDVHKAAEESGANQFIEKLPKGYETPLMRYFEDDGLELSIGQWQKLSVSRAFYADSDILILDEPTASLDAIAEQEIFSQFDRLRQDKTTIFVSHRLSSATTADKIIVLKEGEIIEVGTHRELMAADGEYARLFSTQAKRYIEAAQETSGENDGSGDPPQGGFPGGFPGGFKPPEGFKFPEGFKPPEGGFPGGFPGRGGFPGSDRKGSE
jgi:ABC-type multidrug transport system fused ATPase/permease subunit